MRFPQVTRIGALGVIGALLASAPTAALETDPYEAWGHELRDATDALNAKINYELDRALAQINRRRGLRQLSCETVADHVAGHFRMIVFHPIEMWASKSPLIDRYPPTEEAELLSRKSNMMGNEHPLDLSGWLPMGPTIEVHGVRIGTDKLAHFFSGGDSYYEFYKRALRGGMGAAEARNLVIDRGIFSEKTFLGAGTSGVLSGADLEANENGMRFYLDLCGGADPQLRHNGTGFELTRAFDIRNYVTVDWDESYNNSGFVRHRWNKVKPRLLQRCEMLQTPWVRSQRKRYAARDSLTATEVRRRELVSAGKMQDLWIYSLDAVCEGRSP